MIKFISKQAMFSKFIYLNSRNIINATIMMLVKVAHNSSKNGPLICILLNAFFMVME